jgi:4a-hydroxytetrahydrobiopterin dehydratase
MDEQARTVERLTHAEISAAVSDLGWRYRLGALRASVRVGSLAQGVEVAGRVVAAGGGEAGVTGWW